MLLNDYFPHNPVVHWMHENEILVFAWLSGLLFLVITWIAMRRPKPVPGQLQNALEWIVESMDDVCGGLLGSHKERYIIFICALFFYILTINLLGIIPGFMSATSSLDLTLALALITFAYVQSWDTWTTWPARPATRSGSSCSRSWSRCTSSVSWPSP